jgi:hypothetical protein
MFGDALSTPAKTSDAAVTLFIGGVLTLFAVVAPLVAIAGLSVSVLALLAFPLAVLPALVLRGYYVAVVAAGATRERGAPSIVRWGTLLSDGVKSVVISVGYLLPAVLLVALAVAALVALVPPEVADPATSPSPSAVESSVSDARALGVLAVFVLGSLFLLGYALLYAYLRPAALAVFAVSGSLREAFRLGRVRSVAGTGDYAVGWLLAGLLLVVGGLFVLPLSALLVGFFLLFYLQVVAHSLYGRGAADVLVPETGGAGDDAATEDGDAEVIDDAGFPSEWASEPDEVADDSGADDDVVGAGDELDSVDADETLTDWDDVSAAVESSASADADDSGSATAGAVTAAGGVSPAVQSGRGVAVTETDHADSESAALGESDGDNASDHTVSGDDTTSKGTFSEDDDTTADGPFDWGPADDR